VLSAALLLTKDKERTEGDVGRFLRTYLLVCALAVGSLLVSPLACGQAATVAPPQTVVDILHQVSDKADVIFAGQVLAIRRPNEGVVEVEFRVDQAIRGCTAGTPYILREWAGLWAGDNQRYRVGQRLLMLLHAPSAAGMSSPVGGPDGAIPIRQGGVAPSQANDAMAAQPPYVDLRWLGVRVPHAVSYGSETTGSAKAADLSTPFLARQTAISKDASGSVAGAVPIATMPGNASSRGASVPAQQASVNAVMGLLTSWQRAQHAAP
jgi:hypothetical protein